ncbi:MAG: hypothetical protein V4692_11075 [Bdellovibrionota bacterium]
MNLIRLISMMASVVLLSAIGSCDKPPAWKSTTYQTIDISRQPADIPLPAALWEKIKYVGSPETPPGEGGNDKSNGVKPKTDPITEFAPVTMYLIEKNRGILGGKNLELKFPQGGGELDLSDFVKPLNGSFYVLFQFEPELEEATHGVFFLGGTVPRKVDGETVGSDCNKYFDITKATHEAAKGQGLLVNTTSRRHVSALAGTYFFAATGKDHKVRISSIVIRDRNSRDLECKR